MEKSITLFINKSTPKKLTEEIVITKPLKRLTISIDVEKDEYALMGYIVIRDEKNRIRFQKMAGYGEKIISIGKHAGDTTISGVPGPIGAGTWTLTVFLFTEYIEQKLGDLTFPLRFHISDRKAQITETIGKSLWVDRHYREQIWLGYYNRKTFYSSRKRWYKGDFHTHTHLSDGKETIENAMRKAVEMDMDFYVPTEHNVVPTGWIDDSLLILPGVEITTEIGHCNLIGIDKMPERLPEIMEFNQEPEIGEYLHETIREAKKRNWIVSINHPFLTVWKWKYGEARLSDIDCIEIINDPTYTDAKPSNDKAIRFLDFLWQNGHRIWGIGGSDSHNLAEERYEGASLPSIAGDPGTYVHCDSLTPELLVEGVKKGHIYVSRFCTADIRIESEGREFLPGDKLENCNRTVKMEIEVKGCSQTPEVYVIVNGERKKLVTDASQEGVRAADEVAFREGEWNWARFEVRTKEGDFLLYSNPVWQGTKKAAFLNYKEALEVFDED